MTPDEKSIQIVVAYEQRRMGYAEALNALIALGADRFDARERLFIADGGDDVHESHAETDEDYAKELLARGYPLDVVKEMFSTWGIPMPKLPDPGESSPEAGR